MSSKVGLSSGVFLNLMRRETVIYAEEAKYYGLVHQMLPEDYLRQANR